MINFDVIYEEQLKGLRDKCDPVVQNIRMPDSMYLKEFRTIVISGSRQSGKSTWVLEKMRNTNSVYLVPNTHERLFFQSTNPFIDSNRFILNDGVFSEIDFSKVDITFIELCLVPEELTKLIILYEELAKQVKDDHIVCLIIN